MLPWFCSARASCRGTSSWPSWAMRSIRCSTAPGREVFSPVDMSRRAAFVDGAASIDPQNQANTYISYYTYGHAIALGIDLAIRSQFPGKSLDDWMRAMWRRHPDVQKPYTEQDLEQALAEATGSSEFAKEMFRAPHRGAGADGVRRSAGARRLRARKPHRPERRGSEPRR